MHPIISSVEATVEREHASADEFFADLNLGNSFWNAGIRSWVFRGHADADWKLLPSAMRKIDWSQFFNHVSQYQSLNEMQAMREFMHVADRSGLVVPEDSLVLRSLEALMRLTKAATEWPPDEILSALGAAQHYGLPTRLLDWSWKPKVAAYFAATGAIGSSDPTKKIVVYALRRHFVLYAFVDGTPGPRRVEFVVAPQASNPHLAAQAGLFTLDRDVEDGVPLDERLQRQLRTHEGSVHACLRELPFLVRMTLPHSETAKLLRLLALDGVSAASIYPGYAGVISSLRERASWSRR